MNKPETPEQWAVWSATEVMGWETGKILPLFLPPRRRSPKEGVYCWKSKNEKVERFRTAWDPYSDLNHCRELEMKLKEMGLHIQYSEILIPISNNGKLPKRIEDDFMEALRLGRECQFRTTTATASQRLRAIWQVMKEEK